MRRGLRPESAACQRGFTLVEILVVVVIIGILAATTTLSLGTDRDFRALQDEARRLQAVIQMAADEAILQNTEYGLAVKADRYAFLRYDADALSWQELEDTARFAPYELPDGMRLLLELEGEPLALAPDADEGDIEEPAVLLLSSGETTPFKITILNDRDKTQSVTLSTDGFNAVELQAGRASF